MVKYRAQGDEEYEFLGLTSKPRLVVSGLGLKTSCSGLMIYASKSP
jgi:hypothetical protein